VPYLLRRVTFATGRVAAASRGGGAPALQDFALSGADLDGLSVFHAAGDPERNLIVAAIACVRKNTDKVDLLEIPEADVEALGTVTVTMGTTPVARANVLHRSLAWPQLLLEPAGNQPPGSRAGRAAPQQGGRRRGCPGA